ncbi:hypothetical protein BDN70DRAFT_784811, partial [Pholiota conissans]
NPLTPMALLPPDTAEQLTLIIYVAIATLAIQTWDTLVHLLDDYILVTKHPIKFPTMVYFISRWTTLAYLVAAVMLNATPIGESHCDVTRKLTAIFYLLAVASSELLFFLHVRAVYIDNLAAVSFLFLLWIASFGSSLTPLVAASTVVVSGVQNINIGPITGYCIGSQEENAPEYLMMAAILPGIHDIFLFFALAYKILRYSCGDNDRPVEKFKTIVFGHHLPRFSKSLFLHGQAYILCLTITNIVTIILISLPSVPPNYGAFVFGGYPGVMIMNVMAGRLYRNTKSG